MLTKLRIQNFKSWRDTGSIRLAPITVFFGANSAGKTSLLQFLLMLKQTSESSDRSRVVHFGDDYSLVELGYLSGFDLRA
jgi:AAA15 family ATPase/GTPase